MRRQGFFQAQVPLVLWLPVLLGVGIGLYFAWPVEPFFTAALAALAVVFLALLYAPHHIPLRGVGVVVLGFALAAANTHFHPTPMLDAPLPGVRLSGTVLDSEQHGAGVRLLLGNLVIPRLPPGQVPPRIHLTLSAHLAAQVAPQPGQVFSATATLLPLSEPLLPGGFDFRRNAFFQGIGASGYALGKIQLENPPTPPEARVALWFASWRKQLQAEVKRNLSGDAAGLAIILLTGDKTSLSDATSQAMRAVGLAHLLAIAGLHVGLVVGIVFFLLRRFLCCFEYLALQFPIKKWAAGGALLAATFYTLQVNAPTPTRRALIMAALVLLGVMVDRVSLSLRTLALAATLLLLLWPYLLLSPGFQLSFAAVAGIIAASNWQREKGRGVAPRQGVLAATLRHGRELGVSSLAATLATLPFALYQFQEAGLYSIPANMLAIPLTSFYLMPLCVLVDLLWPLGLAAWPLRLLQGGLNGLIAIATKLATLPGAFYTPPAMPLPWLLLGSCGLLAACFFRPPLRYAGLAVLLLAVGLGLAGDYPVLVVTGSGDAVAWREGKTMFFATSATRSDHFLADYWSRFLGVENKQAIQFNPDSCDEIRCSWQSGARRIVWLKRFEGLTDICQHPPSLLINPLNDATCPQTQTLTASALQQHGAYAVYAAGTDVRLTYSRARAGARPWSVQVEQ